MYPDSKNNADNPQSPLQCITHDIGYPFYIYILKIKNYQRIQRGLIHGHRVSLLLKLAAQAGKMGVPGNWAMVIAKPCYMVMCEQCVTIIDKALKS